MKKILLVLLYFIVIPYTSYYYIGKWESVPVSMLLALGVYVVYMKARNILFSKTY